MFVFKDQEEFKSKWGIFGVDFESEEKEERSHQDGQRQYCEYCQRYTDFLYDYCVECRRN